MDIWIVATFWLLWIMNKYLGTDICVYICFSVLLSILWSESARSYSNFNSWGITKLLTIMAASFYMDSSDVWWFQFLCILVNTYCCLICFFFFLAWAFSSCGKWGLFFAVVQGLGSHDFSCYGARALGVRASVVSAHRLSNCGLWT